MMGTWATGPPPGLHTQKRVNRLPRRHRGTVRCDCGAGVAVAVDSGGGDDGVGTATTQMLQSSCFQCRPRDGHRCRVGETSRKARRCEVPSAVQAPSGGDGGGGGEAPEAADDAARKA